MRLELLHALGDFGKALLRLVVSDLAGIDGFLAFFDDRLDLIEIFFVLFKLLFVLANLLLDFAGQLLGLGGHLADLLFDLGEHLGHRAVARRHQALELLNQLAKRALHLLGKLLVSLLRFRIAGLGVLLGSLELGLRVFAVFLGGVEVALLDCGERVLHLGDGGLAIVPGFLSILVGLLRSFVEILQLIEDLLVLVKSGLGLVVEAHRLVVIGLRSSSHLAYLGENGLQGLLNGSVTLLDPILHALDDLRERVLDGIGEIVGDFLKLVYAVLRFCLRGLEVRFDRIRLLGRVVPLLLFQIVDGRLAGIETLLARLVALLAVLLDVDTGLDPLAAVLVDGVLDLLLDRFEFALVLGDLSFDLIDEPLGLIDVALELLADRVLQIFGSVLDRGLRLVDRVHRALDGGLRHVDRVLRARGHRRDHRCQRRAARGLDGRGDAREVCGEPADQALRHRGGRGRAHLDRALPLDQRGLRERHARLADADRHLRRHRERGLDRLHRGRHLRARRRDRVLSRCLDRVEAIEQVLERALRNLDHAARRFLRGRERLLRLIEGSRGRFRRRVAHLGDCIADGRLDGLDLLLDRLQRLLRLGAGCALDLVERLLDRVHSALRGVKRSLRLLRSFAGGLERPARGVFDLARDRLSLFGGLRELLGELRQVLHRRRLLVDRVPARVELGRVAGVGEEDVVGADDEVLPVDALAGLLDVDDRAGHDLRVAADAPLGGDERTRALVELGLCGRFEQVLLPGRVHRELLRVSEHLLDQVGAGHGAAHLGELVAALALLRRGRLLLLRVPALGRDLRDLIEGVHLLHEAPDVLHPGQRRDRVAVDLRGLEGELLVVDEEAIPREGRALGEEVIVGEVPLEHVVVDDLAVFHVGLQAVALRDLRGKVRVLDVLVSLGDGALVERVAGVEARHDQARRAIRREHHLERRDLGLADAGERALVAELDLDLGAGLELVALRPLVPDVRKVDLERAGLVHVIGDADSDDRGFHLGVGCGAVHREREVGHHRRCVIGQDELQSRGRRRLEQRREDSRGTAVFSMRN